MQKNRQEELLEFCGRMGVDMHNLELLNVALTHSSYANEAKTKPRPQYNERIEFLGDSVLSIIVSTYMYNNFPKLSEGKLTKLRAHIVCEGSLYKYAQALHIGDYLQLGRGEELCGGREKASLLADAFEAVLGAVYLDCGMRVAREYLLRQMRAEIDKICCYGISDDHKTHLQEYLQRDGDVDLAYEVLGTQGPEHDKIFEVEVLLDGKQIGTGKGRTKKDAEQMAAMDALKKLHVK